MGKGKGPPGRLHLQGWLCSPEELLGGEHKSMATKSCISDMP